MDDHACPLAELASEALVGRLASVCAFVFRADWCARLGYDAARRAAWYDAALIAPRGVTRRCRARSVALSRQCTADNTATHHTLSPFIPVTPLCPLLTAWAVTPPFAVALSLLLCIGGCVHVARSEVEPGARAGHNLVYDRGSGATLLLFGYSGSNVPPRTEILAWDGAGWSVVDRAGPGFRSLAGTAIDEADGRLIVFGGAGPGYQSRYGDTWQWIRGDLRRGATRGAVVRRL
jgi:hypothetical protein